MTVKLNNIKRKKGLFYLIAIAVMVAIVGISCSESPTAPANFSETEDFIEAPAPEVKPEQTPTAPEFKITDDFSEMEDFIEVPAPEVKPEQTGKVLPQGATQFEGKTFVNVEDATHKVTIEFRQNPAVSDPLAKVAWGVSTKGKDYQFHSDINGLYSITHDGRNGKASFFENGYLKIWFNPNQSDLITLKLVK